MRADFQQGFLFSLADLEWWLHELTSGEEVMGWRYCVPYETTNRGL